MQLASRPHDQPLVSIALSAFNAAETIGLTIASILGQTYTDWELLVLDDGSTDATARLVREIGDDRIRLISDGQNRGLAVRLNQAIDLAQGELFARIDADDIAYPDRLEKQVRFLIEHPEVDLLACAMMVFAEGGQPVGFYPTRTSHAEICAKPLSGFYFPHPTWLGRIRWFRHWRYDPDCRKAQDQDLLLRAYSTSRFAALSEPLIGYRQERISVRKSFLGRFYFSRAIVKVARGELGSVSVLPHVALQIAKGVADAIAITTGLERRLLRHRAQPFAPQQARIWTSVWNQCSARATSA